MDNKVVLAYSGGLDTSVAIKWLNEQYNMETIAVLIDCGQPDDLNEAYDRALEIGAIKAVVIDAKDDFVNNYILPSIKANVMYEKYYPLATALARPLIVEKLVDIAKIEGAGAIAHDRANAGRVHFDTTALEKVGQPPSADDGQAKTPEGGGPTTETYAYFL